LRRRNALDRPRFLYVVMAFVLVFLFAPILLVVVFSFNATHSLATFSGTSLRWYKQLMHDSALLSSLVVSLEIAAATTVVSAVLGTLLALGLVRAGKRWTRPAQTLAVWPLLNPEIATAVGLLLFFTQFGLTLSPTTITIAHITWAIPYVALILRSRIVGLDPEIEDAARDLGATDLGALRLVVLPLLWPAIIASGLLIFVMSFDDFVTSYFTTGAGVPPLPVAIYSMIKHGVSPEINAVGTVMMFLSVGSVLLALAVFRMRSAGAKEKAVVDLTGGGVA
jgi:ABC-type spermidine/putrescine transport system permease subunit II